MSRDFLYPIHFLAKFEKVCKWNTFRTTIPDHFCMKNDRTPFSTLNTPRREISLRICIAQCLSVEFFLDLSETSTTTVIYHGMPKLHHSKPLKQEYVTLTGVCDANSDCISTETCY